MAGSVPAGRAAHSACLIEPGGSIVVFGGTNGQRPFDELWLLHVGSSRWEQLCLPSSLHKPTARSYHSYILYFLRAVKHTEEGAIQT